MYYGYGTELRPSSITTLGISQWGCDSDSQTFLSTSMANIISPHFGFRPTPVEHSPSPLSFGFGLSPAASQPGWQPPGIQSTHATQFTPSPSAFSPQPSHKTSQKRRHDDTDGDELMDRSPTPERRPIRPLKQMRIRTPHSRPDTGDHNKVERCSKSSDSQQNDSVDVGMLLGALAFHLDLLFSF